MVGVVSWLLSRWWLAGGRRVLETPWLAAALLAVMAVALLVVTRPRAGSTFATWAGSVARAAQHHTRCPIAIVDHSRSGHLDRGSTS